jgi:hypothetical protein
VERHDTANEFLNSLRHVVRKAKRAIVSDFVQFPDLLKPSIGDTEDLTKNVAEPIVDGAAISDDLGTLAEPLDLKFELLFLKARPTKSLAISLGCIQTPDGCRECSDETKPG